MLIEYKLMTQVKCPRTCKMTTECSMCRYYLGMYDTKRINCAYKVGEYACDNCGSEDRDVMYCCMCEEYKKNKNRGGIL